MTYNDPPPAPSTPAPFTPPSLLVLFIHVYITGFNSACKTGIYILPNVLLDVNERYINVVFKCFVVFLLKHIK